MNSSDTNNSDLNIDKSEIARFEALANRWWDREGEMKALHDINPLRANYIDGLAPVSEKTLLDIGCGAGILSEAMAQRGAVVTGLDMGQEPLNIAKLHLHESNLDIEYQQSTAETYASKYPNAFDIVTCMEMLEHVPDPASVIKACATLCKPGGDLFFSTINRNPKSYAMAIIGAEYLLSMVPKGTHSYEKLIKPSELTTWLREAGLIANDITGMEYNPLTSLYRLSDNTDVNYLIHARKPAK